MFCTVISLLAVMVMTFLIILKARAANSFILRCEKSEIMQLLDDIPDDAVIEIWIGGNSYEHKRASGS